MSHYDYQRSIQIVCDDHPFYALIMAALRQADDRNKAALERAFPRVAVELQERVDAPYGLLPGECTVWDGQYCCRDAAGNLTKETLPEDPSDE